MLDVIVFDADDTLWHSEPLYRHVESRLLEMVSRYGEGAWTSDDVYAVEKCNLEYFGYGAKGFALSLIETAIELTRGEVRGRDVQTIIDMVKEMMRSPVQLLEHAGEVVARLSESHRLMLLTKGDLFEQEAKIARSGLAERFGIVEIVSDKTTDVYRAVFARHGLDARRVLMVGNSLRSDILPVVELGGYGAHIPYPTTWVHELVPPEALAGRDYFELESLAQLPDLVERLEREVG